MRARQIEGETPRRSFVLVLDAGDEVVRAISQFAEQYELRAAHFIAIGALAGARLGYWLPGTSDYEPIEVAEQVEVLSLVGNVAWSGSERRVHAHITIGTRDGTARGGHLLEGRVNPTLEVILHELPEVLRRTRDAATGLPLLDLRSESADLRPA
ncbi:MAG TPA: PPC domain-containing DNA-binding protein [Gemmatimonadaceae bacterium]|nr:PPC domain-containing DNA-binding protein [Gemmatimonadaceae bacterium]